MNKRIKSHVQIPKVILKNFSFREDGVNENNKRVKYEMVHVLDLSCRMIQKANIKSLDTVEGYYSPDMESFLGANIEGVLGDLMKNARRFYQGKISQYNIDYNIIHNFACYSFLRSKLALDEVNKPSWIKDALSSLGCNVEKMQEDLLMHPESLRGAFDNYDANVFENHSAVDLVVPRNCIYYTGYKSGRIMWFIPFSPRLAFALMDKQDASSTEKGAVLNSDDDELIRIMNLHALKCEIKVNNGFIVSHRVKELEELLPHLHEIEQEA